MSKILTDTEFDQKQSAIYSIIADGTNMADWAIPTLEYGKLTIPKNAWDITFPIGGEEQKLTRSMLDTEKKDVDRGKYEPILNEFVASWVKKNPLIPDDKKKEMFVHIDSGDYVRTVIPGSFPIVTTVDTSTPLQVKTDFIDSKTKKGAKADGVNLIQTFVFISEASVVDGKIVNSAPATDEDYSRFGNDSSEMKTITKFKSADAGKSAYLKFGFANNVGLGTLSRVLIVIIPS